MKCRKRFSQTMILSSFIFKQNHIFIEEEDDSPSGKVVTVEETPVVTAGIDKDGIGSLLHLPALVFWMKNVGILK